MISIQSNWDELAVQVLQGKDVQKEEALSILQAKDEELLAIMNAAYRIRSAYFGNRVKLNYIINAKSGWCPEDCGYCAQSIVSEAPIDKYSLMEKEELIDGARRAMERKASTYCIVASGRGPNRRDLAQVIEAVEEIKATMPIKVCACLGVLSQDQAELLKEAGVDRYNHNLNTSESHFGKITSTHTFNDRVQTVERAKASGMSPCSGCIVGMGESDEQLVEAAFALKALDADSIPVNFLHSIPGTPLQDLKELDPRKCLKVLAMMRFIHPTKEIRISGGREINLRSMQAMGLYAADAMFVGDYLTTEGQAAFADHQMIEDLGFEIEVASS
ncbi:biotin synthase BioB [Marinicrinis lubricantis]|uniref:Biotin synthase n=1 Tax=Marinicrinis lubricantis TaxID=2086470 RepID=A0ABW1IJ75_9BACL